MRIPIDKIGSDGLDLDEVLDVPWLKQALGQGAPFAPAGRGRLTVHLDRIDDVVRLSGRARIELEAQCSRCLGPVPLAIDTPIEVALFPQGGEPGADGDGEVADEDLGVSTYEDDEIDLSAIVHDEVFLELPMSPICSESCEGLCPSCGKDLNTGPCGCVPQTDDRWQALKHIQLKRS